MVTTATASAGGAKRAKPGSFEALGLSKPTYAGIRRMGFKMPTPIQRAALPVALSGVDTVAMARTGSGKTAAFVIPIVEKLAAHSSTVGARALILSPTRELAAQTAKVAASLAKFTDLRIALLIGGEHVTQDFEALASNPDVLVATPGRLIHLLAEVPDLSLAAVQLAVYDEADRLFEMGFATQLRDILQQLPASRQTMLFSATLPAAVAQFARAGLRDPQMVRLDAETKVSEALKIGFLLVRSGDKPAALLWALRDIIPATQQAMIFAATRHHVEYLLSLLRYAGISARPIYGSLDPEVRKANLARFRKGADVCRCLIVTDVAARGLDVPLLDNVINYDFPDKAKLFVHRAGRVARAGRTGLAISLVAPTEQPYMADLHIFLHRTLAPDRDSALAGAAAAEAAEHAGATPLSAFIAGAEAAARAAVARSAAEQAMHGYTVDDMQASDVHYGALPSAALGPDLETVSKAVASSLDITALAKSANNAYEAYNRTRGQASRIGVRASRAITDELVHPLARSHMAVAEAEHDAFVKSLAAFRPKELIMEVQSNKGNKLAAADMVQRKRRQHASYIAAWKADQAARDARADELLASGGAPAADESDDGAGSSPAEAAPVAGQKRSRAQRSVSRPAPLPEPEEPAEPAAPAAGAPSEKKRVSAAARRRAKKTGHDLTTAAQAIAGDAGLKRSARLDYKEADQYISAMPTAEAAAERHFDLNAGAAGVLDGDVQTSLLQAALDLAPDEAAQLRGQKHSKAEQHHFWDPKKKKFVRLTQAEIDARKAGKNPGAPQPKGLPVGEMYKRWTKKTQRAVSKVGDLEEDAGGHGGLVRGRGGAVDWRKGSKDPRRDAARAGGPAGQPMSSAHAGRTDARGRSVQSELRSASDIVKMRDETAFQKVKNAKGGFAAARASGKLKRAQSTKRKIKKHSAPSRSKRVVKRR